MVSILSPSPGCRSLWRGFVQTPDLGALKGER
jgi:hypothetical protein